MLIYFFFLIFLLNGWSKHYFVYCVVLIFLFILIYIIFINANYALLLLQSFIKLNPLPNNYVVFISSRKIKMFSYAVLKQFSRIYYLISPAYFFNFDDVFQSVMRIQNVLISWYVLYYHFATLCKRIIFFSFVFTLISFTFHLIF